MPSLIAALAAHAATQPATRAIEHGQHTLDYAGLYRAVAKAAGHLADDNTRSVAIGMENGAAWVIADLAALAAGIPCVPLPAFFTPAQQAHALRDAGASCLLTDRPGFHDGLLRTQGIVAERIDDIELGGVAVARLRLPVPPAALPAGTAKITYTSGTTGTPKGVCLSWPAMSAVAQGLATATSMGGGDRHACLLPMATLLENIGGVYSPLFAGACIAPAAGRQDTDNATLPGDYGAALAMLLEGARATTAIMIPQMLRALVSTLEAGRAAPAALRFLAVGGARVAPALLQRAAKAGLPVLEGYGLSECASVVALNTPRACRTGSVGKPLPHAGITFADDGEILVTGATLLGYAGSATAAAGAWPTGDLGHMDADGFLHLTGRKKDLFITAFGRNVSPDWVESELAMQPAIAQSWVHGEARAWNAAVIVPTRGATAQAVAAAIADTNRNLPGYAQIRHWIPAREPFSAENGELTANGRLRRSVIAAHYAAAIHQLYLEHDCEFS
jgi:long-subunit acyl-CoA synthetase (AMP-forming)